MNARIATPLPFFRVVEAGGEDAAAFLHGQLSNHIEDLQPGEACFATYNTPKGRVITNMLVWRRAQGFLLLLADDLADAVVKRLRMFVLRSKVVFSEQTAWRAYGFRGDAASAPASDVLKLPFAEDAAGSLSLVLAGGNGLLLAEGGLSDEGSDAEQHRWFAEEIRAGRPWIARATTETCVAQMLNQHRLGGVHFKKGCYPGQEIIARAQYRGQVKRGLIATASAASAEPGSKIEAGGEEAGVVVNQAAVGDGFVQLAVIKFSAEGQPLTVGEAVLQTVQVWFEQGGGSD